MDVPRLYPVRTNLNRVDVNGVSFWFSYQTVVAFEDHKGLVVSENVWSQTTGKHLNSIQSDKSLRVPYEKFRRLLAERTTS